MTHLLPDKIANNEEGFVLVAAMMVMVILLVIGLAATKSTNVEQQISANDRLEKQEFFNQETCLATTKMLSANWLTTAFVATDETAAFFPPAVTAANDLDGNGINDVSEINDANGITIASFEARSMEVDDTTGLRTSIASLTTEANDFPPMSHTDKPPPGSGYSPKDFEVRRYVVTCQSPNTDRNSLLQEGVYKIFNAQ